MSSSKASRPWPGRLGRFSYRRVERIDLPELRKAACPERSDRKRTDPADDDGRNRTKGRGHGARSELAELIGRADKDHIDGIYATAQMVRRPERNQALANIDGN